MSLQAGLKLGPYEILALVGAGGMGEVYRARDTRLGRIVAIKVVSAALHGSAELRRRFHEEGRLAAQLDHPRICRVYDVGTAGDTDYLVMEFIEGRSLAERLRNGALPLNEAIGCAIEIASALDYAHARGVVHQDLKPGNILLTRAGVKVIDFGLSTLRQRAHRPSADVATRQTAAISEVTPAGQVSGTVQYMPPERLKGAEADYRSDIFAFGAVVYEMVSGRRAFEGTTAADLIAAILTSEPPSIARQELEGQDLDWLVQRCLAKEPAQRWQSMADVAAALKWIASRARRASRAAAVPHSNSRRRFALVAAAGIVALATLGFSASRLLRVVPAPTAVAFTVAPPPGARFTPTEGSVQTAQLAVSPDGKRIAFVASGPDGVSQLWVRPIDSAMALPLAGTVHATYPFWSASSRSLGFFTAKEMRRADLEQRTVRTIAPVDNGRGATWGSDDVILFAPNTAGCIYKVKATGGNVQRVTTLHLDRGDTSHRWPQLLPDGRHFIYFVKSTQQEHQGIYYASVDAPGGTLVVRTGFGGTYAAPHHLFYVSDNELLAEAFDATTGHLRGDPRRVVTDVGVSSNFYGAFSASMTGVLAYAGNAFTSELVWVTRDGRREGTVGTPGRYVDFRLAPDGRSVAVAKVEPPAVRTDLRLYDLARGTAERLTTSDATDASPIWSPDGSRLVFRSNRDRVHDLYIRSATSGGGDRLLLNTPRAKYPTAWFPDGRRIVYHIRHLQTAYDIWSLAVDGSHEPEPLVRSEFNEMQGQISPDGRWIAYTSDKTSQLEVYVQPVNGTGRPWQVSVGGGSTPHWRGDGRELFYLGNDGRLQAVTVQTSGNLLPGSPSALFPVTGAVVPPYLNAYDVDVTGQRFLVRVPIEQVETQPLTVLVNWSRPLVVAH